jgi:hypothetical protein
VFVPRSELCLQQQLYMLSAVDNHKMLECATCRAETKVSRGDASNVRPNFTVLDMVR